MSDTEPTLAKLTMKLSSPSGYQATTEARVSPQQWGAIQSIVSGPADGKPLHAQLVRALQAAQSAMETSDDQEPQMIAALSQVDAALVAAGA